MDPTRRHAIGGLVGIVVAGMLIAAGPLAGCGDDEASDSRVATKRQDAYFSRNPYALTCGRVLAINSDKARQFHIAAFSLARDAPVRGLNRNQVWARMVNALLELCKHRRDADYRPARDAVRLVRSGRYEVRVPPKVYGSGRSER